MIPMIRAIIKYAENSTTQEKLIEYLRAIDFKFINHETLISWHEQEFDNFEPKKAHEKYSFMVRAISGYSGHAHKLRRPKYDNNNLIFAFKLYGKRKNKVHIYHKKKYLKTIYIPWQDKEDINFRKMKITLAFPDELNYVERRQWRTEHLKHSRFSGKYPFSPFYLKWKDIILAMSEHLQSQ